MNDIVLISDFNFLEGIGNVTHYEGSPEKVLEAIDKLTSVDVFFIELDYLPEYTAGEEKKYVRRTAHAGIEVLKRLRLKHYCQHCVVFSFLPREHFILSDPKNIVLYAPGLTFLQLPLDLREEAKRFQKLFPAELEALAAPQDLRAFFKAEMQVADDRHFVANWWGCYCLWKVQRALQIYNKESVTTNENLQAFFTQTQMWQHMNSLPGLMAQYLNPLDEEGLLSTLEKEAELAQKDFTTLSPEEKEELKATIEELKTQIKLLSEKFPHLLDKNNEEESRLIQIYNAFVKKIFSSFERMGTIPSDELKKDLENELKTLSEKVGESEKKENQKKQKLRAITGKISQQIEKLLRSKTNTETLLSKYNNAIKNFRREQPPKILYVDDQAEEGWAKIFCRMIYGTDQNYNFVSIVPEKEAVKLASESKPENCNKPDEWAEDLTNDIIKQADGIDLLILDLRLQGEKGDVPIERVSGIRVLKALKERDFACPILITTASNKWRSYKATEEFGALAYWQKKGLDERNDNSSVLSNYIDFLVLVHLLCYDKRINFLYKTFLPAVSLIKTQEEPFWWQTAFWRGRKINEKIWLSKNEYFNITAVNVDKITAERYGTNSNKGNKSIEYDKTGYILNKKDITDVTREAYTFYFDSLREQIAKNRNTNILNRLNAITLVYLFQALERIYLCGEEDHSFRRIALILSAFRYPAGDRDDKLDFRKTIDEINNARNNAVHRLIADKNNFQSLVENILNYLKNTEKYKDSDILRHTSYITGVEETSGGKPYFILLPLEDEPLKVLLDNFVPKVTFTEPLKDYIGRKVTLILKDDSYVYVKTATLEANKIIVDAELESNDGHVKLFSTILKHSKEHQSFTLSNKGIVVDGEQPSRLYISFEALKGTNTKNLDHYIGKKVVILVPKKPIRKDIVSATKGILLKPKKQ